MASGHNPLTKEAAKHYEVVKDFKGINTRASRNAIDKDEFAWLQDMMPIGPGNLPVVPQCSAQLAALGSGNASYIKTVNLEYATTATFTALAVPIAVPDSTKFAVNDAVVFDTAVAPFVAGTTYYVVSKPDATHIQIATSVGGAAVATGGVGGASTIHNLSQTVNYLIVFTADGAAYAVDLATNTVTTIGAAATFVGNSQIDQWKNERILIASGNGYWDWDQVTLTHNTGLSAPGAATCIASYQGRVWISFNRTVQGSRTDGGAGSTNFRDFTGTDSAIFIMTDPTLHSSIQTMLAANNFLYIFGEDSINVIGDVRSTNPVLFSNTNISASVGTIYPMSVYAYLRGIWFATKTGFYSLIGVTPNKISSELDGLVAQFNASNVISAGAVNINNILCAAFAFYGSSNPYLGLGVAVYFDRKWFVSAQAGFSGSTMYIAGAVVNGKARMFAVNGHPTAAKVYELFQNSTSVAVNVITALDPMQSAVFDKQATRCAIEVTNAAAGGITSTPVATIDSELLSKSLTFQAPPAGSPIYNLFRALAPISGKYIGYSVNGTLNAGDTINGFWTEYELRGAM